MIENARAIGKQGHEVGGRYENPLLLIGLFSPANVM
jgi:hypothetical protein